MVSYDLEEAGEAGDLKDNRDALILPENASTCIQVFDEVERELETGLSPAVKTDAHNRDDFVR